MLSTRRFNRDRVRVGKWVQRPFELSKAKVGDEGTAIIINEYISGLLANSATTLRQSDKTYLQVAVDHIVSMKVLHTTADVMKLNSVHYGLSRA